MILLFHTSLHIFQATHYLPLGKLASSTPLLITSAPLSLFLPTWTILYRSPNPKHNLKKLLTLLSPSIPWLIFKSTLPNLYLLPNKAQPTSHSSTILFFLSHPSNPSNFWAAGLPLTTNKLHKSNLSKMKPSNLPILLVLKT